MRGIKSVEVDSNTAVKFKGCHRDVWFEISAHNFKAQPEWPHDFPCMWATYVCLSEEQHEKFKPRINDAPWNGGTTYYRRVTEQMIDAPPELAERFGKPFYKIGDDFAHLWDHDMCDCYDREYMDRHIKRVIDYLIDGRKEDE